ncbi:MAG: peptidyl-prolyl cis-trans isomerase [Ruminococcaceae bacterium]|nr:peptidyl-prolyl cis-trans isomerase [Oscillospiraceae bacterium]
MMDENKRENIENEIEPTEEAQTATDEVTLEEAPIEASGEETSALDEIEGVQEEAATVEADTESDSTFSVDKVESEAALNDFLNGEGSEEDEDAEVEQEMKLAKYAVDCESCATKVFFELEDLNEDGNLVCPNCQEVIEIDRDAIDYYLVNKEEEHKDDIGAYVADCSACEAVVHFSEDDIDEEENIVCPQCGEKIHIETEVLDAYREKDFEKALKKKKTIKKVLYSLCGVLIALAISFGVIYFAGMKSVVKVDGTSVPMNIYKCVYYIENASNYIGAGYNSDEKASKQAYENSDEYKTWDEFLKAQTEDVLKLYYGIYNAGQKDGYELTDKDKESIESAIDSLKNAAETAKLSFEDYMKTNYGLKISEKDFREYLNLEVYVNSYYKSVIGKEVTDKQLKELYEANPANYEVVTFRYLYLAIDDSLSKEDALKAVENIAKAKNEEEFKSLLEKNIAKDKVAQYKDDNTTLIKNMACANIQDRPVADMLTDPKSKKYQTDFGVADDGTYAEVAMLIEPRHKDDDLIKDTAISQISSEKGQKYIDDIRENTSLKASIGMIIRNITF